jgi:hypothetical protein
VDFSCTGLQGGWKRKVYVDGTDDPYPDGKEWLDQAGTGRGIQVSKGDTRAPMCFGHGAEWQAEVWIDGPASAAGIQIRGDNPNGFNFPPQQADMDSGMLHYPRTKCDGNMPGRVNHMPLLMVTWSTKVGTGEWTPVGESGNEVFVVRQRKTEDPAPYRRWRTLPYQATRNGGTPAEQESGGANWDIFYKTWGGFTGLAVKAWQENGDDGLGEYSRPLCYYRTDPPAAAGMDKAAIEGLLRYGDGDCTVWAAFLLECLAANGLSRRSCALEPDKFPVVDQFRLKPLPGQSNPTPALRQFAYHRVLRWYRHATSGNPAKYVTFWDPSYGMEVTTDEGPYPLGDPPPDPVSALPNYEAAVLESWLSGAPPTPTSMECNFRVSPSDDNPPETN